MTTLDEQYFHSVPDAFRLELKHGYRFTTDCKSAFACRALSKNENYSSGSTFFVHANREPRCVLENVAQSIFKYHTSGMKFDAAKSGAEWWTQVIDHRDEIGVHWDRYFVLNC